MAEYIDRDKLIEQFICPGGQFVYAEYLAAIISRIKAQPAAGVTEVRHGRWIEDHEFFKCSECGYLTDYRLSNFCPDCGAKMNGKVGDSNA